MPVYNAETYLTEALAALLQTFGDFELIISDNGSTDGTELICREYANGASRIRYDCQAENRGAAGNFNRVFELSAGTYFKWAAADDICQPTSLAECMNSAGR